MTITSTVAPNFLSPSTRTLVVGTRGSALALRQSHAIVTSLRRRHPDLAIIVREIHTTGDLDQGSSLRVIGGQGVFVKEIEDALARGTIDLAVHSLKDLPARLSDGLELGAIPRREDVHDALIARAGQRLAQLPLGAVVGTGAARRAAQLCVLRPDLRVVDLRGNVDTRLRKALDPYGPYDAIVLAVAGLKRLRRSGSITEILPTETMLPAPGQGALGLQIRADDAWVRDLIAPLHHRPTALAVTAERAFLAALGVGCQAPVAAWARVHGGSIWLHGLIAHPNGAVIRQMIHGHTEEAIGIGTSLAQTLLANPTADGVRDGPTAPLLG